MYEDLMGDEFNGCAYHLAYRMARELFRFAKEPGILSTVWINKAYELVKEWDEWYKKHREKAAGHES